MKRIAINKAIDKYKKSVVYTLSDGNEQNLTEDVTIEEKDLPPSVDILMSFILQLPNSYRLIFNLFELDGFSHKEIAEMLDISEGTSKSNLHRAKALLKAKVIALKNKHISKEVKSHEA